MSPSKRVRRFVAAALSLPAVRSQLIAQTVMVGANGSFFEPETISAGLNGIVRFVFVGPSHSVFQGSFDTPCFPLSGGFGSGAAGVTNTSVTPPVWDLVVTNVSEPIWFYCANTLPVPHCTSGMVGVINPPSIPVFEQYKAAAKNVSTLPTGFPSKALAGQGATATGFPDPGPSASATTTSTSSTSVSTSTTQSSTPTPVQSSSSNKGAIIGGSVGGAVAVVVVAIVLAWLFLARRGRKPRPMRPNSDKFFDYNAQSPQLPHNPNPNDTYDTPAFGQVQADPFYHTPAATQPSQSNLTDTASVPTTYGPNMADSPARKYRVANDPTPSVAHGNTVSARALPPTPVSPGMSEQKSFHSSQPSTSARDREDPSPNIHMLAREVAAVMMQNTLAPRARAGSRSRSSSVDGPEMSAPPSYVVHH